jgi:hypothetical protein
MLLTIMMMCKRLGWCAGDKKGGTKVILGLDERFPSPFVSTGMFSKLLVSDNLGDSKNRRNRGLPVSAALFENVHQTSGGFKHV